MADTASRTYRGIALSWYQYLFASYKRSWARIHPGDWSSLCVPARPGLVSVVLPCYNGADLVAESIESILSQTYTDLELILVNDGSTDGTAAIFDDYASRDPRVRVIHQDNLKLPRTLSRGFREARGEFMTWTSADNRMKPRCLEAMVGALRKRSDVDMVYANIDLIGEDGGPLRGSGWYSSYQKPPGSEHVHLPRDVSELNVWPNNFIGAAFMYRARVARLLGDYSPDRFCTEDYDYWMRVNDAFRLRHVGFDEPLYDYRFHSKSLTSRDKELRITENRRRLMCFEDFRRSLLLSPGVWVLEPVGAKKETERFADEMAALLRASGNVVLAHDEVRAMDLAKQWTPMSWVRIASGMETMPLPDVPDGMIRVLVATGANAASDNDSNPGWDWRVVCGEAAMDKATTWSSARDAATLVKAIDVLAKEHQLGSIESEAESYQGSEAHDALDATVVICTYRRSETLPAALRSVARQTMDKARFELVVVNNEPAERHPHQAVHEECSAAFVAFPGHVRVIDCPVPGLSHARNAGISASRGRILLFLDDDAIADADCLERIVEAYAQMPEAGVVGGHIVLDPPEPKPEALLPGREGLWSHFVTSHDSLSATDNWWEYPWGANWSARREVLYAIGGFRSNFGRVGDDFGGGEEIVAAKLADLLGYRVAIQPAARVLHRVERQRFTERHVERTVIAGTMVNYQMQKSMYLPMETTLSGTLSHVLSDLRQRMMEVMRLRPTASDVFVVRAHRKARMKLLARQLRDRWERLAHVD